MMYCLYFMTICMILSYGMAIEETYIFLIPMFIATVFLHVADHCYRKTIFKLEKEIIELHKKIDNLK